MVNFDKPMIDLVREIRKRVPSKDKAGIKLANPLLLEELVAIYQHSSDNVLKALTRELMGMAGDPWRSRLTGNAERSDEYVTRIYRGQVQLSERSKQESGGSDTSARQRIYRGQVVA